ncbi:MAG: ParB/RepB/Spo0J family partition protein [Clostridia bacterium]|nr:ParB/RepB/Spo0J family partition protein [Clostridia bacterium]
MEGLPSADDLFKFSRNKGKTEAVVIVSTSDISDNPNNPFKVRDDEKMMETVASVKKNGVIYPAIIRPKADGGYEMVAGHRRKRACELANINEMPCIIRDLTDDEAIIVMVDSNVQREEILPSERAFAYKLKLDAIKRQGKRVDLTSTPVGEKLSIDIIAEEFGQSREQVRRYIRLTELNKNILQMVDDKKIALRPAVEISYLTKDEQYLLLDAMQLNEATPSESQAKRMRELSKEGNLTQDKIDEIMLEEKPNQKEKYSIHYERFEKYIPRDIATPKGVEDFLFRCVEEHYNRQRQRAMSRK